MKNTYLKEKAEREKQFERAADFLINTHYLTREYLVNELKKAFNEGYQYGLEDAWQEAEDAYGHL